MLADLGLSHSTLHQATLSADGRHLLAVLPTGPREVAPTFEVVVVDLLKKKETRRTTVKRSPKDFVLLAALPC